MCLDAYCVSMLKHTYEEMTMHYLVYLPSIYFAKQHKLWGYNLVIVQNQNVIPYNNV